MRRLLFQSVWFSMSLCLASLLLAGQDAATSSETKDKRSSPSKLPLSESQKGALANIKAESEKKAAPIALQFAEVVKQVYENMLSDEPDGKLREELSRRMKEAIWELFDIKGKSIWDSVAILTPEQRKALRAEMVKPGAPSDLSELIPRLFQ